ncbi:MAG TPA: transglycosylase SLT domain-containing protein [Candidatus Paceibacterota bacterium]|nr:transglycosylase SLT domain-containing protein [Candidatus Paceibacterota bacterium]
MLYPTQSTQIIGTFWGPGGTTTCSSSFTITSGGSSSNSPSSNSSYADTLGSSGSISSSGLVPCGVTTGLTPGTAAYNEAATSCNACNIVDLLNRIINFLIEVSIPIAMALFAYAGVLYFTSAMGGAENISRAKSIFRNVIFGFVITLGSYLIIETVLHSILSEDYWKGWNQVTCTDPSQRPGTTPDNTKTISDLIGEILPPPQTVVTSPTPVAISDPSQCKSGGYQGSDGQYYCTSYVAGAAASGGVQCPTGDSACSVSFLQSIGYTSAQANTMSCIAMTESSGQPYIPSPKGSTACGTFQILQGNWNNSSLHSGTCSSATSCNDPNCNAQAAYNLSQQRLAAGQSPYSDWTCPGCNAKAASCVAQYDPGN